jgi:hypothetical protein
VLDGPLEILVLIGTLSPLLYYGRLVAVGIERPGRHPRVAWRPVVTGIDLTNVRASLARIWSDNRLVSATGGAALLAVLALVVAAGAFGATEAATGLPPSLQVSIESFAPGQPGAPTESEVPIGSDTPIESVPVEAEPPASSGPSFEPVPTP